VAKKDGNILGIKVRIDETNLVSPLTATIGSGENLLLSSKPRKLPRDIKNYAFSSKGRKL